VVGQHFPDFELEYSRRGWSMASSIDRVYANDHARTRLGWTPRYDFRTVLNLLTDGQDYRSPLAREVGAKGYHARTFAEGPYPV
jgi:UDP-glucose 4-epimerase